MKERKEFMNHIAKYQDCGKVKILDWQNKNGSSNYAVRYVMADDVLYISGDLGSAVVQLKEKATLANTTRYRIDYFMKRIECSTDLYDFDEDVAEKEILQYMDGILKESETSLEESEQYTCMLLAYELAHNPITQTANEIQFSDYAYNLLKKINSFCNGIFEEYDFLDFGRSISQRVILWLDGLKMAYKQLRGENQRE